MCCDAVAETLHHALSMAIGERRARMRALRRRVCEYYVRAWATSFIAELESARAAQVNPEWMKKLLPILAQFTDSTPGSHIEMKTASVACHYRAAQREFGSRQAHELRMLLGDALSNQPLEVLEGKKVIEVRLRGVSKSAVAERVCAEAGDETAIVAIGDDRTDEELFRALPRSSVTVAVGRLQTCARFAVSDFRAVRRLLRFLVGDAASFALNGGAALGMSVIA